MSDQIIQAIKHKSNQKHLNEMIDNIQEVGV